MPNTQLKECLLLCHGKDCKKKRPEDHEALLNTACPLQPGKVKCQGSCVGPTAIVMTSEGPRWFEDLRSPQARRDLVEYAVDISNGRAAKPSKRLSKRELRGKRRKDAAKKLKRQAA